MRTTLQRGYGGLGLTWSFDPFGNTVTATAFRWSWSWHWRTRANRELLDRARSDMAEKVA